MTRSCLTNNLRCSPWRQFPFRNHDPHLHTTQRTHDVKVTSSLCENETATSFWRNSDVIFGSCVRWESASRALYLRSYIFRTSIAWVARSGGHVFPKSLITAARSKHSSSRSLMTRHWIYPSRKRIHGSVGFFHVLTHWGRVTHICVGNLTITWSAPSHYLNQCWDIVNWTLRNKLQWNFNRYSNIFSQENAFENVVCEMASILSRLQCLNPERHSHDISVVDHYENWSTKSYSLSLVAQEAGKKTCTTVLVLPVCATALLGTLTSG